MKKKIALMLALILLASLPLFGIATETQEGITLIRFAQLATKRAKQVGLQDLYPEIKVFNTDDTGQPFANIGRWILYYNPETYIVTHGIYDFDIHIEGSNVTSEDLTLLLPGLSAFEYPTDSDIYAIKEEDFNIKKTNIRFNEAIKTSQAALSVAGFGEDVPIYCTEMYRFTIQFNKDDPNNEFGRISAYLINDNIKTESESRKIFFYGLEPGQLYGRDLTFLINMLQEMTQDKKAVNIIEDVFVSTIWDLHFSHTHNEKFRHHTSSKAGISLRAGSENVRVAGHIAEEMYFEFLYYPEENDISKEKLMFVEGGYTFANKNQRDAIYLDLQSKLTSLYGHPKTYSTFNKYTALPDTVREISMWESGKGVIILKRAFRTKDGITPDLDTRDLSFISEREKSIVTLTYGFSDTINALKRFDRLVYETKVRQDLDSMSDDTTGL